MTIRLDQYWGMFAPFPLIEDGWYLVSGTLENKTTVDVLGLRLASPDHSKPVQMEKMYPSEAWRKYLENIRQDEFKDLRLYFGGFLCRRWQEKFPKEPRLYTFDIIYLSQKTRLDKLPSPTQESTIWRHWCY